MTRKEQNKILDDKIEANKRQHELDRINAEISAYSSGDLPKYEYLTNKDLNYKPDAFEQARFEYSPLGKVYIVGLDKSDRKEGLLKRLGNIEDKINTQLAIRDIPTPAIKDENNGSFKSDDDVNDEYKTIQDFKKELIDKNILHKDGDKKFDNIVNKCKQTKDKEIVYINNKNKVGTRYFDIYEIFKEYLNENIKYEEIDGILNSIKRAVELYQKKPNYSDKNKSIINITNKVINGIEQIKSLINDDNFRIPGNYYLKPIANINLEWMIDKNGYKQTAEEAGADYIKGKNDNELELIKDFITKINNGVINNKIKAGNEFRGLKQKVTNNILRPNLIKNLERYFFGENLENIEPEKKYEESIAERVKTRRQNEETDRDTQRTFAPSSPPKKYYSAETDEYLKYMEEQEKDRKKFSDEYDSNGWSSGSGLKILTKKQMLSRLPILLAEVQAGNNSTKLKNEIRQILYLLYRSKILTKTVYNNLIKVIVQNGNFLYEH